MIRLLFAALALACAALTILLPLAAIAAVSMPLVISSESPE